MSDRVHDPRTSELLAAALRAHPGDAIRLGALIEPLHERAFGFLLLILALPNFVPVPIGIGGPMGVLVSLTGLQMLLGMDRPWLPRILRERALPRASAEKILALARPLLERLERLCRPRLERLTWHPTSLFSGLLLIVVGFLLALPIPFTNYPFGLLLLTYGVALIERDGAVLLAAWAASLAAIGVALGASGMIIALLQRMF